MSSENKEIQKKDGEEPEIYAIKKKDDGSNISRKDFFKNLLALGGTLVLSSCAPGNSEYANKMKIKQMSNNTITIPCDSPLPPGATCICDCVATSHTYNDSKMICTCDTITVDKGTYLLKNWVCVCNTVETCTCDKVCTCNSVAYYYTYYYTYWYPN